MWQNRTQAVNRLTFTARTFPYFPSLLCISNSTSIKHFSLSFITPTLYSLFITPQTKASYIAQSGDKLSLSRSRGSSGHSRHTSGSMDTSHQSQQRFHTGGQQKIVAIEFDNDDSRHRRIDQGLLDACKEAQMQQKENEVCSIVLLYTSFLLIFSLNAVVRNLTSYLSILI